MKLLLAAVAALFAVPVSAEWSITDLNRAIDSTNFIVGAGCSGTLISAERRLVLTNWHCIENNITSVEQEVTGPDGEVKRIRVRRFTDVPVAQNNQSGYARVGSSHYLADIVAEDRNKDLALLRLRGPIPHTYASPLLPDGETIVRGERVYIVGNPRGEDATLGEGIVSRLRRIVFPWANGAEVDVVQHSAGSTGGNSGGALYNARGQLIGVPAAGYRDASFIGFAVSIELVKQFLRQHCWAQVFDPKADDAACAAGRRN